MDICKKRGRPRKDDRRKHVCTIRLNDREKEMLEYLYFEYDVSEAEALRMCLRGFYNLLRKPDNY